MKNKLIILSIIVFSLLVLGNNAFASITNGTIDPTYHYAWGENVGFVDFANITISDSSLSGSIYGENIGWIDLSNIINNGEGILSGYAWGENVGWIDFSKASIGTDGIFMGGAYGENIGWITFGTTNNKVQTDWRPLSTRPVVHHNSGGHVLIPPVQPPVITPTLTPQTCPNGGTTANNCASSSNTLQFILNLRIGTKNTEVLNLQKFLNAQGFIISTAGAGSPGHETSYFGQKTKLALIKFQKANNITPAIGYFGPITRGVINKLISK